MQLANFSNTSIIDQKSLNTSTPDMRYPPNIQENQKQEFSIMLPKATTKKRLLDSIVTLKSSYITFHSKNLQRSQSYEELSSSSHIQEPKKDNNRSNENIHVDQMIAETRSQNEKSDHQNSQKASVRLQEDQKEQNESIGKEESKRLRSYPEKVVSVLIQNSGLIKREISMINQDETLKNFIDELEFSQKESNIDDIEPSSEFHHEEFKPKAVSQGSNSKSNNNFSSVRENLEGSIIEGSRESIRSVESKGSQGEKGRKSGRPYSAIVITLSIGLNVLFFMLSMTQNIKLPQVFNGGIDKRGSKDSIILQKMPLIQQVGEMDNQNRTVVPVETMKDVKEYREYKELKEEKERLEQENNSLKQKVKYLDKKGDQLGENFVVLNRTHTKLRERVDNVTEKLEQRMKMMDRVPAPHADFAVKCKEFLGLVKAMLLA